MTVLEFSIITFSLSTSALIIFKVLSDSVYLYVSKKSNLKISEYRQKKDIDLYYENELRKINSKNSEFKL